MEKETNKETSEAKQTKKKDGEKTAVQYDLTNENDIIQIFANKESEEKISEILKDFIELKQTEYDLEKYQILFLYDEFTTLSSSEADRIYKAINKAGEKDILLVLNNNGGKIDPAYLISQMCKKKAKNKFSIAVPRRAKSAATLLSLGADEIHMGLMSELGPTDPQIGDLPALGLGNSLEYISNLVEKYPKSAKMFSEYLEAKLDLRILGYFERVTESAAQYAERLIGNKKLPNNQTKEEIAKTLVYHYKDHGFVIDIEEATKLLGSGIVKTETSEYLFANDIYTTLNIFQILFGIVWKKNFTFVGSHSDGLKLWDKNN